jgi:hypothetical protein
MMGGYFSEPYGRVPVISRVVLFQSYPCSAPGLLLGGTTSLACVGVLLFVREVRANFQVGIRGGTIADPRQTLVIFHQRLTQGRRESIMFRRQLSRVSLQL